MRILFLTNGYPPLHTAGTENYTAGLAAFLVRAGHQVSVVCVGDWDRGSAPFNGTERGEVDGVTITRLNLNWTRGPDPNRYLFDNPLTERYVGELLDIVRPDVVHITSCYTLSASVIRAVKARGCPLIVTLTDFWFFCPRLTLLRWDGSLCDGQTTAWECLRCMLGEAKAYRWPDRVLPQALVQTALTLASRTPVFSRRAGLRGMALDMAARKQLLPDQLEQADVIIAPSQFMADMSATCGLKREMQVVPYGHNLDWLAELPERSISSRVRLGYVGRLTPVKGVHVLLQALARLGAQQPIEVHIYGSLDQEPDYAQALHRSAAELPYVQFHGRFGRDQLASVYGSLDVLVVPSLWYENNPLVIQEAFAAGVPVVASRLGGMAEFVTHGTNGLLFEPGSPTALAATLSEIIEQPDLLDELHHGIPPVRTIEEEVRTLSSLYRHVITNPVPDHATDPAQAGRPAHR